jgi:hypothetical protein
MLTKSPDFEPKPNFIPVSVKIRAKIYTRHRLFRQEPIFDGFVKSTNDVYPTAIKVALHFGIKRLTVAMAEL